MEKRITGPRLTYFELDMPTQTVYQAKFSGGSRTNVYAACIEILKYQLLLDRHWTDQLRRGEMSVSVTYRAFLAGGSSDDVVHIAT